MKEIICKIFGHFNKTESKTIFEGKSHTTFEFKDTCKICGHIETSYCTSFEGPTITFDS